MKLNKDEKRRLDVIRAAKHSGRLHDTVVLVLRNLVAYVRLGLHESQPIPQDLKDAEGVLSDIDGAWTTGHPKQAEGWIYRKIQNDASDKVSRSIKPNTQNYGRNHL